eukprot:g197.t1
MDSWQSDLHRVRVLLKDMRRLAAERDRRRRQGGSEQGNGGKARDKLRNLNNLIDGLEGRLVQMRQDASAYGITEQECDRRRGLLADIKRDRDGIRRLVGIQNDNYGSVSRDALFAAGASAARPQNYAGREFEGDDTKTLGERELLQQQMETMRAQDEGLEQLGDTVADLKNLGTAIGEGIDLTSALLGDIQGRVDKTDAALQKRTTKAKTLIGRVSGNCWFYMLIFVLALLLVANISTHGFCTVIHTDSCDS